MNYLEVIFLGLIGTFLTLSPYTKVEESFNIQAIHDMINYGTDLSKYDHFEYPGVVPRSFIGSLFVSVIAKPFLNLFAISSNSIDAQILVRGIVGILNGYSLIIYKKALKKAFNSSVSNWYMGLQLCQFHILYYSSRTLPNMFSFPLTNIAFAYYLNHNYFYCLFILSFSTIVFRSELGIFVITILLEFVIFKFLIKNNKYELNKAVKAIVLGLLIGITSCLIIDSYFWQRFPMVPEIYSFYFNIIQGKSSQWGTQPFFTYFRFYVPKLLLNPITTAFAFQGYLRDKRIRPLMTHALLFITVYSFLPHKEWRFILPSIPIITSSAATMASLISKKSNSKGDGNILLNIIFRSLYKGLYFLTILSILGTITISWLMMIISSYNYPGGEALSLVNSIGNENKSESIYMDVYTCMTGATRFGEKETNNLNKWRYYKTENETLLQKEFESTYDYIVVSISNPLFEQANKTNSEWKMLGKVQGFVGINKWLFLNSLRDTLLRKFSLSKETPKHLKKWFSDLIILQDKIFIFGRKSST